MKRICALVAVLSLSALTLKTDTIELKTGERIEGTFRQATPAGAVIEVAGQTLTIPLEKVKAIYFGGAPVRTEAAPAPSGEAMDALRALRSVSGSGIAYSDYAQTVLDARVKVDRYLSSQEDDMADLRGAIRVAMLEYELASQGWLANLWMPMGKTLEDPRVQNCPIARVMVDLRDNPPANAAHARRSLKSTNSSMKQDPTEALGLLFAMKGNAPGTIWPCASHELAEAERLLSTATPPTATQAH
jgi:hypothetical protein